MAADATTDKFSFMIQDAEKDLRAKFSLAISAKFKSLAVVAMHRAFMSTSSYK